MTTRTTCDRFQSWNNEPDDRNGPWDRYDTFNVPAGKNFSLPFSSVLEKAKQLSLFVDIDADTIGGTPRIGGTRIPVHMVLNAIDEYGGIEAAVRAYRSLNEEQVRDALRFAIHVLESPIEYEPSASY